MSSSVSSWLSATKYQKVTPIPKGATIPMIRKSITFPTMKILKSRKQREVNAASLSELDVDAYKPCEDEPIATKEWVCEY